MQIFRAEVKRGGLLWELDLTLDGARDFILTLEEEKLRLLCDQINKGGEVMQREAQGHKQAWFVYGGKLPPMPYPFEDEGLSQADVGNKYEG